VFAAGRVAGYLGFLSLILVSEEHAMSTRFTILVIGAVALVFVAIIGTTNGATITNASFEDDGNFSSYGWDDPKAISGWTKGGVELSAGTYLAAVLSPTVQKDIFDNGKSLDGSQLGHAGEMQVFANAYQTTLSTTVSDLEVGKQYQLTFYENARATMNTPLDCSVTMNGAVIVASHGVAPVDVAKSYTNLFTKVVSSAFTATSSSEVLTFINQKPSFDTTTDAMWFIDNVQVSQAAVPEPSAVALVFTGIAGLVAYAWRRRHA
jgi:hypothetical protein